LSNFCTTAGLQAVLKSKGKGKVQHLL